MLVLKHLMLVLTSTLNVSYTTLMLELKHLMLVLTSTLALQHRKLHSNTELPASECYTQRLHDQPLNVGTKNCQDLAQNPKSLNNLVQNINPARPSSKLKSCGPATPWGSWGYGSMKMMLRWSGDSSGESCMC